MSGPPELPSRRDPFCDGERDLLTPKPSQRFRRRHSDRSRSQPFSFDPPQQDPLDEEAEPQPRFHIPAWLLSTIVHTIVILALIRITLVQPSNEPLVVDVSTWEAMDLQPMDPMVSADASPMHQDPLREMELETDSEIDFESVEVALDSESLADEEALLLSFDDLMSPVGEGNDGSGAGDGEGRGTSEFYGIEAKGTRFVYILDQSDSMRLGNRWFSACEELASSIRGLTPDQEFLIILYNSRATVMLGKRGKRIKLVEATKDNLNRSLRWLGRQVPNSATLPLPAVQIALKLHPDAVFFAVRRRI